MRRNPLYRHDPWPIHFNWLEINMSTRDFMIAVNSIEQLRNVVGSNDQALFDLILKRTEDSLEEEYGPRDDLDEDELEEIDEQLDEIKSDLKQMLMSAQPPAKEPGA